MWTITYLIRLTGARQAGQITKRHNITSQARIQSGAGAFQIFLLTWRLYIFASFTLLTLGGL